jgi:hypothetical protein
MAYIPLDKCKSRFLYRLHSRNLEIGVFDSSTNGFVGIRTKFGSRHLFTEYHYDASALCGTANATEELEPLPEGISLEERLGTIEEQTKRPVAFDKPKREGGRGWYYLDDNVASNEIRAVSIPNTALFEWLREKEKKYSPKT